MSNKLNVTKLNFGIDNIADKLNDVEAKADFGLMNIAVEKMRYNQKNNFGMRDIEDLAESLKKHGQLHNVVVRPIEGTDEYEIISGERRHRAATMLGWKTLAAKVVNVDDIDSEMMLIVANLDTRELNDIEKSQNAIRLTDLIQEKRKNGEDFGGKKTREVVADKMGIAPATVQKLIKLKKLIPELKKMVEDGDIPLESSNQYAQMPEDAQKAIYEALKSGTLLTAKQAKQLKDNIQKSEEDLKKQIEDLDKTIKEKDNAIEKVKIEAENEKILAVEKATEKIKAEYDNKINNIENELLNAKEVIQKQKENAKEVTSKIREELKAEMLKDKDKQDNEAIKELELKLKQAENNEKKLKLESDNKIKELEYQLEDATDDKKKIVEEYNKKLQELEKRNADAENVERNIEIIALSKQARKVLSTLLTQIVTYQEITGNELSDEAKKDLQITLQFESKLSDSLGK